MELQEMGTDLGREIALGEGRICLFSSKQTFCFLNRILKRFQNTHTLYYRDYNKEIMQSFYSNVRSYREKQNKNKKKRKG